MGILPMFTKSRLVTVGMTVALLAVAMRNAQARKLITGQQ